jgi:hypothetical protein
MKNILDKFAYIIFLDIIITINTIVMLNLGFNYISLLLIIISTVLGLIKIKKIYNDQRSLIESYRDADWDSREYD